MAISTVVSVIEQFLHPALGLCSLELITTTHSGLAVYTRPRGTANVDAFGVHVTLTSWPAGFGLVDTQAGPAFFDRTVIKLGTTKTLQGGPVISADYLETKLIEAHMMFSETAPQTAEVWTAPGTVARVEWILLFGP